MSYIMMHNSNSLTNSSLARTNYQQTNQPRIAVSRSPIIYKNTKILENKVVIPTIINNISPKIINQTIVKQPFKCFSAIQSPSKIVITTGSPAKLIPISLTDRQRSQSPLVQNASTLTYKTHKDETNCYSAKEQNLSKASSPNISQLNMVTAQNQMIHQTPTHSIKTYSNSSNNQQMEQNFQTQQYTNHDLSKQETLKSQQTREFLSSKSSQMYRSTVQTENDYDLLDIVNKYIGGSSSIYSKTLPFSNKQVTSPSQYDEQNGEYGQLQTSGNTPSLSQQYNQILSTHFDSCSKGNYSQIEDTHRLQVQQQPQLQQNTIKQEEFYYPTSSRQPNNNSIETYSSESSQSAHLDDHNKQIYQNAEIVKQQLQKIQQQMSLIKEETFSKNIDYSSTNQCQHIQVESQAKGNDQHEIIKREEPQQVTQQHQDIQHQYLLQQHQKIIPVQIQIEKQFVPSDNILHSDNKQTEGLVLQFTECSNNQVQKNGSVNDEDDKLNLAVYEDENQVFDFTSSDNLDEEKNHQAVLQERDLKNQKTQRTQSTPQQLDPIQEEDFHSGSFSNVPSITHIHIENNINQGFSDNKIQCKQDVRMVAAELESKQLNFQNEDVLNQRFIQDIDHNFLENNRNNNNNNKLEQEFELFDSNFDDIACIGERGSQDNLFSQDSYENILDLYNSGQVVSTKEYIPQNNKQQVNKEHHRSQSDATNCSQNFQTVSSIDAESFRRSLVNIASFGHSPQISQQGQGNEQQYYQPQSATFNQDTIPSEQSPGLESKNSRLTQLIKEQYQRQINLETKEITLKDTQAHEEPKKEIKKNTVGDTIVIIILIFLVMLIGCFFIFFIQDNSLIGFMQQKVQQNLSPNNNPLNITEYVYQPEICYAECETELSMFQIQQCLINYVQ